MICLFSRQGLPSPGLPDSPGHAVASRQMSGFGGLVSCELDGGLEVEPVVMAGTLSPNEALNTGDLQANAFQHIPFLRDQIAQRGYKLAVVGNTYLSPIAFYSKTYKSLKELPNGARVGVPDDPSNESRALIVLRDDLRAFGETLTMVGVSVTIAIAPAPAPAPAPGGLYPRPRLDKGLPVVVNVFRAVLFIILLVALLPVTRLLVGPTLGIWAAIVPLSIHLIASHTRVAQVSLNEVDHGLIEAPTPWASAAGTSSAT